MCAKQKNDPQRTNQKLRRLRESTTNQYSCINPSISAIHFHFHFHRQFFLLINSQIVEMTTLADDIKSLMDLGISLERATGLAVEDRNKLPAPGNYFHPVYFIEQFPSHICLFCILFDDIILSV